MLTVVIVRNCEVVYRFHSEDKREVLKEYRRIRKNVWRRKSAFNQVEFPQKFYMSWYELPKSGDWIPRSGLYRFYVEITDRVI